MGRKRRQVTVEGNGNKVTKTTDDGSPSVKKEVLQVEDVRTIERTVLEIGVEVVDDVRRLVDAVGAENGQKVKLTAMHAARRCLASLEKYFIDCGDSDDQDELALQKWFQKLEQKFYTELTKLIFGDDETLSCASLAVLISCGARWSHLKPALQEVMRRILCHTGESEGTARVKTMLSESFLLKYNDVRLAALEVMTSECRSCEGDGAEMESRVAANALDVLKYTPVPLSSADPVHVLGMEQKFAYREGVEDLNGKSTYYKQERRAYSDAWIQILGMDIPDELINDVLERIATEVIPRMTHPLKLSDFLLRTYNCGKLSAVLSLEALWILIMDHGLDYPHFYEKLYALLSYNTFFLRDRMRFMTLVPKFLHSGYLPGYLVAAFAKRLLRRALAAPPQGALWCMRVVLEMIKRHPSTSALVHSGSGTPFPAGTNFFETDLGVNGDAVQGAVVSKDVFDDLEADPRKSNADKSSLWELEALRLHYCPAVARLVPAFSKDYRKFSKKSDNNLPGCIEDYAEVGYGDLFEAELRRKTKECPLAYISPSASAEQKIGAVSVSW
mmetsp:Transcript_5450/g.16251  ORF Transcript_5450/g.16251 Transcript_5450/m.16251 type:complete len:558 (+) Transcript_5450:123-1796(+)|eukprot:CAMPEP_0198732290 /NCGR_PEP_ID=MMETSP1475-20131203/34906_1 /TAXON_ID= ORGANISM="Unidentified sp., Strain CCMP1999" /NCGR_SAMPLE_ID=MMETSP1475 /ASSEMBLY_ACC=CAM_ASM_001111 /LENGTH=557 /DNA_ID=CAMNT_0044495363 /DNA_START=63 /DNA_END=1736 /DNA_ORIENTATION=+